MAEQEAATQTQEAPEDQNGDNRDGYVEVVTGSTKHPDAEQAEDGKVEAVIGIKVGNTLREAVEKYGEDFVFNQFIRSVTVSAQGKVRRELDKGIPVSSVEQELDDLDPTEKRTTVKDPQAQAMSAWKNMDPEQKERFRALMDDQEG